MPPPWTVTSIQISYEQIRCTDPAKSFYSLSSIKDYLNLHLQSEESLSWGTSGDPHPTPSQQLSICRLSIIMKNSCSTWMSVFLLHGRICLRLRMPVPEKMKKRGGSRFQPPLSACHDSHGSFSAFKRLDRTAQRLHNVSRRWTAGSRIPKCRHGRTAHFLSDTDPRSPCAFGGVRRPLPSLPARQPAVLATHPMPLRSCLPAMEPVSRSALVLCLLLIPRQNILAGIFSPVSFTQSAAPPVSQGKPQNCSVISSAARRSSKIRA